MASPAAVRGLSRPKESGNAPPRWAGHFRLGLVLPRAGPGSWPRGAQRRSRRKSRGLDPVNRQPSRRRRPALRRRNAGPPAAATTPARPARPSVPIRSTPSSPCPRELAATSPSLDRRPGRLRHRPPRGDADAMRLDFPWMGDAELVRVASYVGEQIRHMRCISRPRIDVAQVEAINRNAAVEPGDGVLPLGQQRHDPRVDPDRHAFPGDGLSDRGSSQS